MKNHLVVLFIVSAFALPGLSDQTAIHIKPKSNAKVVKMDLALMDFIMKTLSNSRLSTEILCGVKANSIQQERKFSDGVRRIDMLEVIYSGNYLSLPEQKMFFPKGTKVSREIKNSRTAGIVEEFTLEAEDSVGSVFTFQHDGNGKIVWMDYMDDFRQSPCRTKNY